MAPISDESLVAEAESEEDCWEEAVEEVEPDSNSDDSEGLDESLEAFAKDELGEDYQVINLIHGLSNQSSTFVILFSRLNMSEFVSINGFTFDFLTLFVISEP